MLSSTLSYPVKEKQLNHSAEGFTIKSPISQLSELCSFANEAKLLGLVRVIDGRCVLRTLLSLHMQTDAFLKFADKFGHALHVVCLFFKKLVAQTGNVLLYFLQFTCNTIIV